MNRAKEIFEQGQSIWFDNIDRDMLRDGRMRKMVEDGQIYGVTSNPSIFEAALKNSVSYDDVLQAMAWSGMDRGQIYLNWSKMIFSGQLVTLPIFMSQAMGRTDW